MLFSSSTPKLNSLCSGAGIGGLVLAITIGKFAGRDIHIDLYEARDVIATAGAGISVSRRTAEVMVELGLYEKSPHPSSSYGLRLRKSNAPEGGFDVFKTFRPGSNMHRKDLIDVLKQSISSSCTVHFNKRLTKYEKQSPGSLILYFTDDSTSTADVLVGADGIHSSVRKTFFEAIGPDTVDPSKIRHYTQPSWTGTLVYRSVFPAEKLSELDPNNVALKYFIIFCGKGKHIVSYPVSQGTQINKAGTPFEGHWVSDVSLEEAEEAYQDFEPDAKHPLNVIWAESFVLSSTHEYFSQPLHVVNELPLFTCDRVVLIGDAAHAMTPYCGAGAGQAIEDAFVLGRLLAHPLTTLDNVPVALKAYQDVRLPFAQFVACESKRTGKMYDFRAPGYYDGTDRGNGREEMEVLKEKILDQWHWESKGEGGTVAEWEKAERQLQEGSCNGGYENGTS
ncbi:uncharacterized protein BJ212DRAFT_1446574 [Suillus subaureus]|uniref:FAD-binding domain-containing protein n=1 Tax=Suillus subaureus TaxID=48587 RepID=A0A9P7EDF9_9AGAM|nr:uncharacterized protein BJ212DRAFT_1446574 [Suillus subaureus]KAG1818113.1 hypothetical protein BJ212DRAFT_1446574 [Suillus subaureus]